MPPVRARYVAPITARLGTTLDEMGVDPAAQPVLIKASNVSAWRLRGLGEEDRQALGALVSAVGARWVARRDKGLLIATRDQLDSLAETLRTTSLQRLGQQLVEQQRYVEAPHKPLVVRDRAFAWGERTYVMGIVNATPDSFSGDGLVAGQGWVDKAVTQARQFEEQGVDILDIGGESTRPGAEPVGANTEIARVVPLIERIRQDTDLPISIDTSKAAVAAAALDAGANIVNDVWGLRLDPDMAPMVAKHGAPVVIMHNRSKPRDAQASERLGGRYVGVAYDDLMGDIMAELAAQVSLARQAGIAEEKIILDPGIGFGKTVEQNLTLINRVDELRALGYPLLIGPSRKSFIGYTLDVPTDQRVEGTLAALVISMVRGGADIVRVHDVQAAVRATRMADAILRAV